MSLTEGTQLGVYEITGQIGAGGMGEVYRATDTKLDREVAIKTLPAALASDSDRLARFEREAKLLAALNHPHIAAVHSLGEHEGTLYLAMELVEGETLEEKLKSGALPVEDALRLALQIAEALEAAHGKGVVHRDLKPANIMVNAEGQVKVLDFGLAKAFSNEPEEASPGKSPALSLAMTQQGIILGTAGYMSPEQASGQPTDHRADIWAFGVVVYEMLTGLPLFSGESVPHILADVLRKEPEWDRLPKNLHPRLKLMLERCLTKKPKNRYAGFADARVDIQAALNDPAGVTPAAIQGIPVATPMSRSPIATAALVAAGAIVAGLGVWYAKPEPTLEPLQVVRAIDSHPAATFVSVSADPTVAIANDGTKFLFRRPSASGLFIRQLDSTEPTLVPGTAGIEIEGPVFSPDGNSILFVDRDGWLLRVSVSGGSPVRITSSVTPFGFDWGEDGTILYSSGRQIRQVSENGGESEGLITLDDVEQLQRPQRLPNGDWILYVAMRSGLGTLESSELVIESPSTGEQRVLRGAATDARYLATGHIVYAFNGVLYALPFDADSLEVTGGPVPVVQGVARGVIGLHQFSVSESGHLVYLPGLSGAASEMRLALADNAGNLNTIDVPPAAYGQVRASPDGRWLAFDTANSDENRIIWIHELSGSTAMRRLTFEGDNQFPVWSPDSERVAYQSTRDGDAAIFAQPIDGTGGPERLTTPAEGERHVPESWSPDRQHLSFSVQKGETSTLWILTLADGSVSRFNTVESRNPIGSVFSPDGNWLAYHMARPDVSGLAIDSGIYVEPFPATGARYQAPKVLRDFQPFWSPDGTELRYIGSTASGQMVSVEVVTDSGFSFGTPSNIPFGLTAGRLGGAMRGFDVLPDGRFIGPVRISTTESRDSLDSEIGSQVRIVLNWTEELKRLVPTD